MSAGPSSCRAGWHREGVTECWVCFLQELLTHKIAVRSVPAGASPHNNEQQLPAHFIGQWQRAGEPPWEPFLITDSQILRI